MNNNSISSSGIYGLYFITIICILVIFFTEINNPIAFNVTEYILLFVLMIVEFFIGLSVTNNIAVLFLAVIVTWIVILAPTLLIYTGPLKEDYVDELNSIFSNVIGYLFVANEAGVILSDLNMENNNTDDTKIIEIKRMMLKIRQSQNIFINQLTPNNFDYLWTNLFSPLFPQDKQSEIKEKLLHITNKKFIIGKCIWYFYTCILAITVSFFFITNAS